MRVFGRVPADAADDPARADADAGADAADGPRADVGNGPRAHAHAVTARLRICTFLALLPVALYTAACLVYNAPDSPAKSRIQGAVAHVMQPYFWQDWQLFGPTPGSNDDLIYLTVRMRTAGSDQVVQTSPVEIEQAIDRAPRAFPLNPTKLPGIPLAFDAAANRYARMVTDFKKLPAAQRKAAQADLDKQYVPEFQEIQRFLSARAATMYPGADIVSVKAAFKTRPIIPFSERYVIPKPEEKSKGILETSWMDYVPGVAR
ncbi:DUF5819 family protein [Streptomyces mirabilis]|uniref:DUF5819 family protein n=1 Tax=Streptomyces mirabilis TaxID=68239 RepID=UPI0036937F7C